MMRAGMSLKLERSRKSNAIEEIIFGAEFAVFDREFFIFDLQLIERLKATADGPDIFLHGAARAEKG